MLTISTWMRDTDLGGNDLKAWLREIAHLGFMQVLSELFEISSRLKVF